MTTRRSFIRNSGLTITGLAFAGSGQLLATTLSGVSYVSKRPAPEKRNFTSAAVEKVIQQTKAKLKDQKLAWMFENCFPNTLDTTVRFKIKNGKPDTFVITGDSYAFADFCIYKLGKALGKPEKELDVFAKRSQNYKNVFDKETNLMRGKNQDGTFQSPFSPFKWGDAFTEGNSWHYTWSVLHDVDGLIGLMGGKKKFVGMLDSVFVVPPVFDAFYYGQVIHEIREMQIMNMGNYAHGNQPIQHMIYFNYSELMKDAVINVEMGNQPNKDRGINESDFPYSFSKDK